MAETIIRGEALMLFLNGKSIAHATSHTLQKTTSTTETATKDYGKYAKQTPQRITWTITTDNLCTENGYKTLSDLQDSLQTTVAYFGFAADNDDLMGLGDRAYFTLDDGPLYAYGNVLVQDLNLTAAAGDNATFTATLQGDGPLQFVSE